MSLKKCFVFFILLWCGVGHTVSRVGNGFTVGELNADFPRGTIEIKPSGKSSLFLFMAFPQLMGMSSLPQVITISDFSEKYPEFENYSLLQIEQQLLKGSSWEKMQNSCYLTMSSKNGNTRTVVLIWAPNKGVVVVNPKTHLMDNAVKEILSSVKIQGKLCQP